VTQIKGTTRIAAVIGWPVEHSRSPQIVNRAFEIAGIDAVFVPIGVPPAGFAPVIAGLRAMRALGASVTVPHKLAAAALCDDLTPAARAIGAANCLQFDGDRLVGHNTDEVGFLDGLRASGFDRSEARAVVLGGGGAARAIAYALRGGRVDVIARHPEQVMWTRARPWSSDDLRDAFTTADLVVDCTPVGLGGEDAQHAFVDQLPFDALRSQAWVATLVYHQPTILLERASARGHSTLDGRAMLVHQAARAFTIWTSTPAPIDAMTRALEDSLRGT
jgi:shikimate dehydrogenase